MPESSNTFVHGASSTKPHAAAAEAVMVTVNPLFDGTPAVYVIDHGTVGKSGVSTLQPALHAGEPGGGVKCA